MKQKLLAAALIILGVVSLIAGFTSSAENSTLGGIAICAVLSAIGARKLLKARSASPSAAAKETAPKADTAQEPPQPEYVFVSFSVAGVSFNNDDGTSRQYILRKLKFCDPPFDSGEAEIRVEPYTFKGEPAYSVSADGIQIGSVPREKIAAVREALAHPDAVVSGFKVTGGGKGYNYGAEMAIRYKRS